MDNISVNDMHPCYMKCLLNSCVASIYEYHIFVDQLMFTELL